MLNADADKHEVRGAPLSLQIGCDYVGVGEIDAVFEDFEYQTPVKVITTINQADVSEQEKNEAKTLLRRLLGSKAAVSVLGPGAQSLAAKYFTE